MKLYIKQKVFSWGDKFTVKDVNGEDRYFVEGEIFSWGKKLHVYDMCGNEVAFIQQKLFSFLPRYFVYVGDAQVAEIVKEFTFFFPKYSIEGLGWKTDLEKKVPEKVYRSLETAFSKAFSVVFTQGVGVIEKTYNRQNLEETHSVQDYAVQVKGGRKELKQVKRNAGRSGLTNTALTTVEGIGLGALGIGLPDIVVFVGMLLKGVYETALSYGFAYDTPEERLFILRMMETALTKGPDFAVKNARVDGMIEEMPQTGEDELQAQIQKTGSAFAVDMLLLKFVQGFPLVGILGGAANPVYYNKVMRYVQLKYQKRYLLAVAQRNGYSLRFL